MITILLLVLAKKDDHHSYDGIQRMITSPMMVVDKMDHYHHYDGTI